tara:strand:+ start:659 stop:847 length:189 start_codon:yes stop_codon:yes gene_type:complete
MYMPQHVYVCCVFDYQSGNKINAGLSFLQVKSSKIYQIICELSVCGKNGTFAYQQGISYENE